MYFNIIKSKTIAFKKEFHNLLHILCVRHEFPIQANNPH